MGISVSLFGCHLLTPIQQLHDGGIMSDSINIPLSDPWRQSVTITPEIARKIVDIGFREVSLSKRETTDLGRFPSVIPNQADMVPSAYASAAQSMGAKPVEFDKPAAPADDEATFNAMWDAYESERPEEGKAHERAIQAQIDKIRRGEIPGLTTIDKCSHLINEHARAMNERDTLKAEIELLKTQYCVPGAMTIYANASEMTLSGVELKYRGGMDFDVINHPANELKAEVERLRAELNKQGQAHREAKDRFKAEIQAAQNKIAGMVPAKCIGL